MNKPDNIDLVEKLQQVVTKEQCNKRNMQRLVSTNKFSTKVCFSSYTRVNFSKIMISNKSLFVRKKLVFRTEFVCGTLVK